MRDGNDNRAIMLHHIIATTFIRKWKQCEWERERERERIEWAWGTNESDILTERWYYKIGRVQIFFHLPNERPSWSHKTYMKWNSIYKYKTTRTPTQCSVKRMVFQLEMTNTILLINNNMTTNMNIKHYQIGICLQLENDTNTQTQTVQ